MTGEFRLILKHTHHTTKMILLSVHNEITIKLCFVVYVKHLRPSLPLHQSPHLPHLALKEAMDADLAPVGVKCDGGEASDGGVNVHAGDGFVRHKLRIVMQQSRHLDCDTLIGEDDSGREQDVGFRNTGSLKDSHNQ